MKPRKFTMRQQIKLIIIRKMFFDICDGWGSENDALLTELWKRIDRDLKSLKLTRDDL